MIENKYNLIDETWIPVAQFGRVSLRQIFTQRDIPSLGGNAVEKIAIMKLLLAIAQRAATPADDNAWRSMSAATLSSLCLAYLEKWHDAFWLYGEKPFLQMTSLANFPGIEVVDYSLLRVSVAYNNKDALSERSFPRPVDDADRAILLIEQMAMSIGGKKANRTINLAPHGPEKEKSAPPGPGVGAFGFLHSFLQGEYLLDSLHMNLFTSEDIAMNKTWNQGVGIPPWEKMPVSEACEVAVELTQSLMGRLVPISRFVLFLETGLYLAHGIVHNGLLSGVVDPSVIISTATAKPTPIWTDPKKRPWRQITSLLSYVNLTNDRYKGECLQIQSTWNRAKSLYKHIGIWSGGLSLKLSAGEQFAVGKCDYVDSLVMFQSEDLGEQCVQLMANEMSQIDRVSRTLYGAVTAYGKSLSIKDNPAAARATSDLWVICESLFSELIEACNSQTTGAFRKKIIAIVNSIYNKSCQKETARQLAAWAKNRPKIKKYLLENSV